MVKQEGMGVITSEIQLFMCVCAVFLNIKQEFPEGPWASPCQVSAPAEKGPERPHVRGEMKRQALSLSQL